MSRVFEAYIDFSRGRPSQRWGGIGVGTVLSKDLRLLDHNNDGLHSEYLIEKLFFP